MPPTHRRLPHELVVELLGWPFRSSTVTSAQTMHALLVTKLIFTTTALRPRAFSHRQRCRSELFPRAPRVSFKYKSTTASPPLTTPRLPAPRYCTPRSPTTPNKVSLRSRKARKKGEANQCPLRQVTNAMPHMLPNPQPCPPGPKFSSLREPALLK